MSGKKSMNIWSRQRYRNIARHIVRWYSEKDTQNASALLICQSKSERREWEKDFFGTVMFCPRINKLIKGALKATTAVYKTNAPPLRLKASYDHIFIYTP